MADKTGLHKKAMLTALTKCLGNVTEACEKTKTGRSTHYDWLNEDPEYKQAVADIKEAKLDIAESKLQERIEGVSVEGDKGKVYKIPPDVTALMYYLNCQGRERGYSYKQQVEHSGGITINGEVKVINTGSGIATSEDKVNI